MSRQLLHAGLSIESLIYKRKWWLFCGFFVLPFQIIFSRRLQRRYFQPLNCLKVESSSCMSIRRSILSAKSNHSLISNPQYNNTKSPLADVLLLSFGSLSSSFFMIQGLLIIIAKPLCVNHIFAITQPTCTVSSFASFTRNVLFMPVTHTWTLMSLGNDELFLTLSQKITLYLARVKSRSPTHTRRHMHTCKLCNTLYFIPFGTLIAGIPLVEAHQKPSHTASGYLPPGCSPRCRRPNCALNNNTLRVNGVQMLVFPRLSPPHILGS